MTNAATRLADVLDSWNVPPGQSLRGVRGFEGDDDLAAWREHTRVAILVAAVDETLQGMKADGDNVEMFEAYLPKWYAGVHAPDLAWSATPGAGRDMCEPHEVQLLRALGMLIDAADPLVLMEEDRRSLTDVLTEAKSLLEQDRSDIPKDVRRYLWGLIAKAQTIIEDHERFGTEAVRQVSLELSGALHAQGEHADHVGDKEKAGRWKALAVQLMLGFAGGASSGGAQALLDHAIRQIGN